MRKSFFFFLLDCFFLLSLHSSSSLIGHAHTHQNTISTPKSTPKTKNTRAHAEYAWLAFEDGELETARAELERALDTARRAGCAVTDSEIAEHEYRLGRILWTMGGAERDDPGAARARFEAASVEEGDCQAAACAWLGHWYREVASDPARAANCYARALEIDPDDGVVARNLAAAREDVAEQKRRAAEAAAGAARAAAEAAERAARGATGAEQEEAESAAVAASAAASSLPRESFPRQKQQPATVRPARGVPSRWVRRMRPGQGACSIPWKRRRQRLLRRQPRQRAP